MNLDYRSRCLYESSDDIRKSSYIQAKLTSNEKVYHDKTTYCRPVVNYYNEQFIYKTMERNARLKRLVRKLAIARQKEKETVSWNNFINELKNKHGLECDERHIKSEPEEYVTPEIINDYYNTKFSYIQSTPCKHLLREFYGMNDEPQSNCTFHRQFNENRLRQCNVKHYVPHERNPYSYPTSSQGRLIIMDKERRCKQFLNHCPKHFSDKNLCLSNGVSNRTNNETHKNNITFNGNISHIHATSDKTTSVQGEIKFYPNFVLNKYKDKASYNPEELIKDDSFKNVNKIQVNNKNSNMCLNRISLTNIDTKLETLIESINKFINEIKSNKSKRTKVKDFMKYNHNNKVETINEKECDPVKKKTLNIFDSITSDFSDKTFNIPKYNNNIYSLTENDTLSPKGMQVSNTFTDQPCSMQITFEVPTKDCSTEVTKSISKQISDSNKNKAIIEEISTPEHTSHFQRMTIAVNTDPLSVLGLLKISTDTFKHLLSYMPNIDYYSYLSLLQLPLVARKIEPHYVCNICGADFNKPSQLSDHIRGHDLGKTKDCCVCHHVLDMARKSSLFRCQYCGQLFSRAYCRELHQESCARRLGRHHDVTSSLMLLR